MKKHFNLAKVQRYGVLLAPFIFMSSAYALHILPDHVGAPQFSKGVCPIQVPPDGAGCTDGGATCPAFWNPQLIPQGYNSVSWCQHLGNDVIQSGPDFFSRQFTVDEQKAFLKTAHDLERTIKDNITLTFEPYAIGSVAPPGQPSGLVALATEFFTPVCMVDTSLPPYASGKPTIVQNANGSFSYKLPQTFDTFVQALQAKNNQNQTKFKLTDFLPKQKDIKEIWSSAFTGLRPDPVTGVGPISDIQAWDVANMFANSPNNVTYDITSAPTAPSTVCASPSNMKALGLDKMFNNSKFTFAQINSPSNNIYTTMPSDGAVVVADFKDERIHGLPYSQAPNASNYFSWINDESTIVSQQLPKAFFEHHNLKATFYDDCAGGMNGNTFSYWNTAENQPFCSYPKGYNFGIGLTSTLTHEVQHLMGIMWSEYYKQPFEGNVLGYAYGNMNFPMDLFILDSDAVNQINLNKLSTYASVPRNMESQTPQQHGTVRSLSDIEPWIQYGQHDHVFAYIDSSNALQVFPLQNYSIGNPDGDIAVFGHRYIPRNGTTPTSNDGDTISVVTDPLLTSLPASYAIHPADQSSAIRGGISYNTERELAILSAIGYDVDYSVLQDNVQGPAPTAVWYQACFKRNPTTGYDDFNFTKPGCVYSVEPDYIATCNAATNTCGGS